MHQCNTSTYPYVRDCRTVLLLLCCTVPYRSTVPYAVDDSHMNMTWRRRRPRARCISMAQKPQPICTYRVFKSTCVTTARILFRESSQNAVCHQQHTCQPIKRSHCASSHVPTHLPLNHHHRITIRRVFSLYIYIYNQHKCRRIHQRLACAKARPKNIQGRTIIIIRSLKITTAWIPRNISSYQDCPPMTMIFIVIFTIFSI